MYIFLNTISVHRGYWWVIWSWSFGSIASRSHSLVLLVQEVKIVRSWPKITLVVGPTSDFGDLLCHNHWICRGDLRLSKSPIVKGAAVLVTVSVDATVHPTAPGDNKRHHMYATWREWPTDIGTWPTVGWVVTVDVIATLLNDRRMTKVYEVGQQWWGGGVLTSLRHFWMTGGEWPKFMKFDTLLGRLWWTRRQLLLQLVMMMLM